MPSPVRSALSLLFLTLSLGGCDGEGGGGPLRPDAGDTEIDGETLYMQPHADGNTFACNTCHAISEPAPDGFRRPGHPIGDAANRPTYKNGQLDDLRAAVNTCRDEWMNADPFSPTDARWLALEAFLETMAGDAAAPALEYEIVTPPTALEGGDEARGQAFFNGACAICHGTDAVGTERAPVLEPDLLDPETIALRVRTSGVEESAVYTGLTGGRMPFWAADRISDDELRGVIAFIESNDPPDMLDAGTPPPMMDAGMPPAGCASEHPRVGQVATLVTRFHDVVGTATIVDDCTVEITDFGFDGTGIDVRIYGASAGDFRSGFNMSDMDLRRSTPYAGETIRARLPEDRTLDELDDISVWCVPAGISFGDGTFAAP